MIFQLKNSSAIFIKYNLYTDLLSKLLGKFVNKNALRQTNKMTSTQNMLVKYRLKKISKTES